MFKTMLEGTQEDWSHIAKEHMKHQVSEGAHMIMDALRRLEAVEVGFGANPLVHRLLPATVGGRDGGTDEEVVAALCHDIGKVLSIPNHGAIGAEVLRPYVSDDMYHVIKHHQDFQGRYYYDYLGKDSKARDRFKGEPWYDLAEKLVDRWDAPAFDPDYPIDSLESFEPELTRVFSKPLRAY